MAISDPIADMLTKIRNAYRASHKSVFVNNSKVNKEIIRVLGEARYIGDFSVLKKDKKEQSWLKLSLVYDNSNKPVVHEIRKISKPGRRVYAKYRNIERIRNGFGITIVSTSHGVLTDKQAREKKVGGELICSIW